MNAVTSETLYDVFLSYSPGAGDDAVAMVRAAFSAAGFTVFDTMQLNPGAEIQDQIWSALAVSDAIVVLATPSTVASAWTGVEIGAAQAWHKPIFVLHDTLPVRPLPDYLAKFQLVPISRLDDVIHAIRKRRAPMSSEELEVLRETYVELNVPADQLLANPSKLTALAQRFNRRNHSEVAGEVLAHELITMRKRGALPRLKRA